MELGDAAPIHRTDPRRDSRSLHTCQSLMTRCLGELIRYAYLQGYELTLGESFVMTPRKGRDGVWYTDGVHMPSSLHYSRLAIDLNLFRRGVWISDSTDPAWADLAGYWESLDSACCAGFRFDDANHFSVTFGGKK